MLGYLADSRRPGSTEEQIHRAVGGAAHEVMAALARLEDAGEIIRLPRHRWALPERSGMLTGRVKVERSGRALVILDIPDAPLVVERGALRPAMDGDRVLVEPQRYARGGLHHAKIHRVLERARQVIVGVASPIAKRRLLPVDERIGPYVVVLADDSEPAPPRMAVAARIVEYPGRHSDLTVRVERVLGEVGKLATEIESACLLRGIEDEFPEEAQAEAEAWSEPSQADLEGRSDLRDRLTITVDPADAKDHDDACSIETTENGWRLAVSIADVSHYVRPGTALDDEAYERSTSVYFPGRSVPMLPEKLSADLASLLPGIDRLAVSAFLEIDRSGIVRSTAFARTIIHSSASLTYEQVQSVLDEQSGSDPDRSDPDGSGDDARSGSDADVDVETEDARAEAAGLGEKGADPDVLAAIDAAAAVSREAEDAKLLAPELREALRQMALCAEALHRRRMQRGAVDMDLPEAVVELDATGEVKTIRRRARRFAHRLVEEFMLAANEAVAERIDRAGGAFLYRIHERPDDDALVQLAARVRALGLRLDREGGYVTPRIFQKLLEDAAGRPEARQVNNMVLRTMTRARYSAEKEIHFGLASRCYTHFTSPIRRYPDIVAHRALLAELAKEERRAGGAARGGDAAEGPAAGAQAPARRAGRDATLPVLPTREALVPVAEHTSDRERRAMDAERDVAAAAGVLYMARHVGRRLTGTVSGVDRYGYWVELDVAFVEGFVHVGKLHEYFDWVAERMELQSRTSNAVIHIGQRVEVRVVSVDLAARRIELEPASASGASPARERRLSGSRQRRRET